MDISVIFSILYLVVLGGCLYGAWKRHWIKGALSLGVVVLAFAAAYFLARGTVLAYGNRFFELFGDDLLELFDLQGSASMQETDMLQAARLAVSMLAGMLVFWIAFLFVWLVGSFVKRLVFSKIVRVKYASYAPEKNLHWLGMVVGLASFCVVSFVLLYPLGMVSEVGGAAAKRCDYELSDSILTNPIVRLYGAPGRGFFDRLTQRGDGAFRNSQEGENGAAIYLAMKKIVEGRDADGKSTECITEALSTSRLLPGLASELVANAADSWKNGRAFLSVTLEMPQGRSAELVVSILEILSQWRKENLIQDVNTAIQIYKLMQKQGILEINDGLALMEALSQEEFVETLFSELSQNDDFIAVIPKVMHFGIGSALDAMGLPMKDEYLVEFDAEELSQDEWQREARAFSVLIHRMCLMAEDGESFDAAGFVQDLYQLRDSKLLGNLFMNLLIQLISNMPGIS